VVLAARHDGRGAFGVWGEPDRRGGSPTDAGAAAASASSVPATARRHPPVGGGLATEPARGRRVDDLAPFAGPRRGCPVSVDPINGSRGRKHSLDAMDDAGAVAASPGKRRWAHSRACWLPEEKKKTAMAHLRGLPLRLVWRVDWGAQRPRSTSMAGGRSGAPCGRAIGLNASVDCCVERY